MHNQLQIASYFYLNKKVHIYRCKCLIKHAHMKKSFNFLTITETVVTKQNKSILTSY